MADTSWDDDDVRVGVEAKSKFVDDDDDVKDNWDDEDEEEEEPAPPQPQLPGKKQEVKKYDESKGVSNDSAAGAAPTTEKEREALQMRSEQNMLRELLGGADDDQAESTVATMQLDLSSDDSARRSAGIIGDQLWQRRKDANYFTFVEALCIKLVDEFDSKKLRQMGHIFTTKATEVAKAEKDKAQKAAKAKAKPTMAGGKKLGGGGGGGLYDDFMSGEGGAPAASGAAADDFDDFM